MDTQPKIIINSVSWNNLSGMRSYTDKFVMSVSFEVTEQLSPGSFDIAVYYGASTTQADGDLLLEEVSISNLIPLVTSECTLVFDPPGSDEIDDDLVHGITNLQVVFSYRGQPWLRLAYYISNLYDNEEFDRNPPRPHRVESLTRRIHDGETRNIQSYAIDWVQGAAAGAVAPKGSAEAVGYSGAAAMDVDGDDTPQAMPPSAAIPAV